jgi:seryl-tRNA synthetase
MESHDEQNATLHKQCTKQISALKSELRDWKQHFADLQKQVNELSQLWESKFHQQNQELQSRRGTSQSLIDQMELLRKKNQALQQQVEQLMVVEQRNFILQEEVERMRYHY